MAKDPTTGEEIEEEIEEIEEEGSLREDLEAAIVVETEEEEPGGESEEEERQNLEKSKSEEENAGKTNDKKDEGEGDEKTGTDGAKDKSKGISAPLGFTPESREQWGNVPDVVKAQIVKREKEIETAMANTGEFRRTHQQINRLAESYAPVLAAEGAETPMGAITALFKTVAELRMGTPQQKAVKMASLIGHYAIDVGMLDSALSGATPEDTVGTKVSQLVNEQLAPFRQMMSRQEQEGQDRTAAAQNAVNNELVEFAKGAEFLNDVREEMADFIDLAAKRGVKLSFQEAYDKAIAVHPTIGKIIAERETNETLRNSGERLKNKRDASSSLPASSGMAGKGKVEDSIRGALTAAWDGAAE